MEDGLLGLPGVERPERLGGVVEREAMGDELSPRGVACRR